jgi:hypothetical protein
MARSIIDIKQIILTAKSNEADLAIYTSISATQIFNLWAYIVSVAIWTLEVLFDKHKTETDAKIASLIPGTLRWYHSICLAFQLGDSLQWVNSKFCYQIVDASKMIIKRCAIKEVSGQLRIKVCKEVSGVPVALSTQELNSFKAYMTKIKFAGTNLAIVSYNACSVKFGLKLFYDPLILTPAGLNIITGINVIESAIDNYLKQIVYGGVISRTKIIDAIQSIDGVADIYFVDFYAKEAGASNWDTITTQNFESIAGYFKLDSITLISTPNV